MFPLNFPWHSYHIRLGCIDLTPAPLPLQKVRQVIHCLIRPTLQLITLKHRPSPSDHLGMMINERVKFSLVAHTLLGSCVDVGHRCRDRTTVTLLQSHAGISCLSFLPLVCVFIPLWRASCAAVETFFFFFFFWETAQIKIQVQGRAAHLVGMRADVWDSCVSVIVESINYWIWQEISRSSEVILFPTGSILKC